MVDQSDKSESVEKEAPLSDENFVQNLPIWKNLPVWLWSTLALMTVLLIFGTTQWYETFIQQEERKNPFAEVTNREMSIFLWDFPSFIRSNMAKKNGYLSDFYVNRENFNAEQGEDYAVAPPDLIFLYHTWSRLIREDFLQRPIPVAEFSEFLEKMPEWQPAQWKKASPGYVKFVPSISSTKIENLSILSNDDLPIEVRMAFQGWKNYFKEGEQINVIDPTVGEMKNFLAKHPHYSRNYWQNIQEIAGQTVSGPNYLKLLNNPEAKNDEKIPMEQVPSFLRVAYWNAQQAAGNL